MSEPTANEVNAAISIHELQAELELIADFQVLQADTVNALTLALGRALQRVARLEYAMTGPEDAVGE